MMTVFEASANLKVLPHSLVQQFHFTDQEALLCLGLVQGKSFEEVADELKIDRSELRGSYKSLLRKTGSGTEAKLITTVLSNPSVSELSNSNFEKNA